MTSFETSVRIARPIEEVFALLSDPLQFPRWNSAVRTVRPTSDQAGEAGTTYAMERDLPSSRVENGLEVVARRQSSEFHIRTTSGPTPFDYRYRLVSEGRTTLVHLAASVELPGAAALLGPLAARTVRRGVDANLATLKRILEGAGPS